MLIKSKFDSFDITIIKTNKDTDVNATVCKVRLCILKEITPERNYMPTIK